MLTANIDDINEDVLNRLIKDSVLETRMLEYKRVLKLKADDYKVNFLKTVSSFANSSGGEVIFGIAEDEKGKPVKLMPLENFHPDQGVLRIRDICHNGIEPTIKGLEMKPVELFQGGYVLVLRIQRSLDGPHMVIYRDDHRFYIRDLNGKRRMGVSELREAMELSESIISKIRTIRNERLERIKNREFPVPMGGGHHMALHVIPFSSVSPQAEVDIYAAEPLRNEMIPLTRGTGRTSEFNYDGIVTYSDGCDGLVGYVQLFRNGSLESVDRAELELKNNHKIFSGSSIEDSVLSALDRYFKVLQQKEVEPPFAVGLSLLNVQGYSMYADKGVIHSHPYERNNLIIPEVIIEEHDSDLKASLKIVFDTLWQSVGRRGSESYGADGRWNR